MTFKIEIGKTYDLVDGNHVYIYKTIFTGFKGVISDAIKNKEVVPGGVWREDGTYRSLALHGDFESLQIPIVSKDCKYRRAKTNFVP